MAITEAKKRNNANYTAKCDYINVRPLKAEGAAIRAAAEASGKSLQKYILEAVRAPDGARGARMAGTQHQSRGRRGLRGDNRAA